MLPRKPKRREVGTVTSAKMDKTVAVRVDRLYTVPKYGKRVRRHTTYFAHDEKNEARAGDQVEIIATRPLSKTKRWRLVRVIRRAGEPVEPVAIEPSVALADAEREPTAAAPGASEPQPESAPAVEPGDQTEGEPS